MANVRWHKVSKKPKLGEKVLVRCVWRSGVVDYNVAIYARSENDRRRTYFFQNFDHQMVDSTTMGRDGWAYNNVVEWVAITELYKQRDDSNTPKQVKN